MPSLVIELVEARSLLIYSMIFLIVTRMDVRLNTEVGNDWLLGKLKLTQSNLLLDVQHSSSPQSKIWSVPWPCRFFSQVGVAFFQEFEFILSPLAFWDSSAFFLVAQRPPPCWPSCLELLCCQSEHSEFQTMRGKKSLECFVSSNFLSHHWWRMAQQFSYKRKCELPPW